MKKQIISALTATALLSGMAAFAADLPEKVEISFKVGDSALMINGETVEVMAPYVVGDGTTLVPIRVITEAFGAEVTWDGDTQSVGLKYPDVDMTIKIGSKSAVVNTHSEALEEAPELHDGTTMVPLRFISETFGANVTYDDNTRLITVTKEIAADSGSTVAGVTDKDYIGDSFYGWTMKNPKTMQMEDRSFDGTETEFSDGTNYIYIRTGTMDDDVDADTVFNNIKNTFSDTTISIADKTNVGSGITLIHFRCKSKQGLYDVYEYIKGKNYYDAYTAIDLETDSAVQNEILEIANSFSITAKPDYYDLSNAKDGYREFTDKDYNVKLTVPADWTQSSRTNTNTFHFYNKNDNEAVNNASLGIYSKSSDVTAALLAEHDMASNVSVANPSMIKASEIETGKLNGIDTYYYTIEYSGGGQNTFVLKDVFFELGDYVYNISAQTGSLENDDKILNSLEVEELDSEKIGIILRDSDLGGSNKFTTIYGKMKASNTWMKIADNAFMEQRTGGLLAIIGSTQTTDNAKKVLTDYVSYTSKTANGSRSLGEVKNKTLGGKTIYYQTITNSTDSGVVMCSTIYTFKIGNKAYCFTYVTYDIYNGGSIDDEVLDMLGGFEV
ncbi:MAG: copper amine oxidase N-terminal domain-containing protein [Oscillospiraceae bacterium]|nr:copper amine oxidase N-terminal domain-containing protein [Oscillospiraceae bacterium]